MQYNEIMKPYYQLTRDMLASSFRLTMYSCLKAQLDIGCSQTMRTSLASFTMICTAQASLQAVLMATKSKHWLVSYFKCLQNQTKCMIINVCHCTNKQIEK